MQLQSTVKPSLPPLFKALTYSFFTASPPYHPPCHNKRTPKQRHSQNPGEKSQTGRNSLLPRRTRQHPSLDKPGLPQRRKTHLQPHSRPGLLLRASQNDQIPQLQALAADRARTRVAVHIHAVHQRGVHGPLLPLGQPADRGAGFWVR